MGIPEHFWLIWPTVGLVRFACPFWGWLDISKAVGMESSFSTVLWASCNQNTYDDLVNEVKPELQQK